jgi:hypothetical protein
MRKILVLAACAAVPTVTAFANDVAPYLTGTPNAGPGESGYYDNDTILVNNLVTSGAQIRQGVAGCAYYNSWVAFDYTPTSAVTVRQITLDYLYNTSPLKNTINFQLYRGTDPGVGSIVRSWSVSAVNYEEKNTGWIAFSRPVWRSTIPIPDQRLSGSTKYWFAYTSLNSLAPNIVYWCVQATLKEDQIWWYLNGSWGSGISKGVPGYYEQSYALWDVRTVGVAPTSFGKIKTLYH